MNAVQAVQRGSQHSRDTAVRPGLRRRLEGQQEAIAAAWYARVRQTGFAPYPTPEVRGHFSALADRLTKAVAAKPEQARREGREIGATLARLHFVNPEALGGTLDLLGSDLLSGLPPADVALLAPRLTTFFAALAAGFCAEARNTILVEQEQVRQAELAARQQAEAELADTRRRLAENLEAERLRLARDLHDEAVQDLLAVRTLLQTAARSATGQSTAGVAALDTAAAHLQAIATKLRGLIGELRPAGLEEYGLTAALEGYVKRLQSEDQNSSLPTVTLDLDPVPAILPAPLARCLFRVAQEGLRNTLRHASARSVTITLRVFAERVSLTVQDDGVGFTVPTRLGALTSTGHFGLVGLAEQVAWLDGRLTMNSALGAGTTLTASLPLTLRITDGEA